MKRLITIFILASLSATLARASDDDGDWQFVGHSVAVSQCSSLNRELPAEQYKARKTAYKLWLGGFFTALNMVAEAAVLPEKSLEVFYLDLEEACKQNPDAYVGTMVSELSAP